MTLTTMNWESPAGGVCTCCDKPIPPRRPSLAARAKADAATLREMRKKCSRYEGVIAEGIRKLKDTRHELEIAQELNFEQERRIAELEGQLKLACRSKKERRGVSGGEHARLLCSRSGVRSSKTNIASCVASHDEHASY